MGQVQPEADEFRLEVFKSQVKASLLANGDHLSQWGDGFRNDQLPRTIYSKATGAESANRTLHPDAARSPAIETDLARRLERPDAT